MYFGILETVSVTKCGTKSMFELGQCQTDIFSVTAPGNNAPPVICGQNSNEHSKIVKIRIESHICNRIKKL